MCFNKIEIKHYILKSIPAQHKYIRLNIVGRINKV